jgi:hypothetical protein
MAAVVGRRDIKMPYLFIGDRWESAEESIGGPVIIPGYDDRKDSFLNSEN